MYQKGNLQPGSTPEQKTPSSLTRQSQCLILLLKWLAVEEICSSSSHAP